MRKLCGRLACCSREEGEQEGGRPSVFVVEAVHVICCTGSRLRKTGRVSRGKPFWALRYFGPAKVVKERVGRGKGSRI